MSFTAPEDAFLDVNDAHLRVYGNVHADGLKLGQLEVVTTTSTGSTIQFLHQHTAFTTTSNIVVGTTNHDLFVNTADSRVGILTSTPTTALDVNGTVKATAFDGNGALLTGIPSSAINGTLSQWTTVTGPKIHYSEGQVGIGIADPLWTLDVVGDINFTGTLREDGNPFVSTPWTIESSPTALSYTGGNVGIGAATPTAKLEVTGNAHVSTDLSVGGNLTINTISAAATHSLAAVTALGASTGETLQLTHATTGLVATGNVEVGGELTVTGNVAVDTDTLFVDTTENRVGIGTTSPATKLHVEHYGSAIGDFEGIRIANHATNLHSTSRPAYEFVVSDIAAGTGIGASKFAIGYRGTTSASRTDRLVIDASGNVGIGTTSPNVPLEVNGEFLVAANSGAWSSTAGKGIYMRYSTNGSQDSTYIQSIDRSTGTQYPMTLEASSFYLKNGNVGIGTTAPSYKLHIQSGDASMAQFGPSTSYTTSSLVVGAGTSQVSATAGEICQMITTNGNMHLDAATSRDIYMNLYSGNYIRHHGSGLASDDRLKTNEELITNATETLLKLSPQKYTKARSLREAETREPFTETGLIAQDIWYDAPELRHTVLLGTDADPVEIKPEAPVEGDIQQDPDYSSWGPHEASVNYDGLIAYLIKSNQELHARIQALENA